MPSYKFDEIIDKACEKKNLDRELMKSVSTFIFQETKEEMGKFDNLIVYLEGFISFFYGKKRLEDFNRRLQEKLDNFDKFVPYHRRGFIENKSFEEIVEIKRKVENLLSTYDEYIKEKNTIKQAFKQAKKQKHATDNSD